MTALELILVTGRFPQRSETFIYRKAVALARQGHRVTVVTRHSGEWALYPEPLPPSLRVHVLPPDSASRSPRALATAAADAVGSAARAPAAALALYERCRRDPRTRDAPHKQWLRHLPFLGLRADVVHFEFLGLAAMYPLAGELVGAPTIVSCRGQDIHLLAIRPTAERDRLLAVVRAATAVHCVSTELARTVEQLTGRRDGICINRPAVDVDHIAERPPAPRGPDAPLRVLASGRLVWVKGFDYLLAAFALLARRGVEFHAELVGYGELYSQLRFTIEDLGLHDRVTLVGGVSSADVLALLQATDVFVLSSVEEGISNSVLEAMASGVPVVTTAAGGMAEAITDGVEGLVAPIRDAQALAERLERLARDPALRARMGRAGRARAEAEFSMARQVAGFEALYRSVVDSGTDTAGGEAAR